MPGFKNNQERLIREQWPEGWVWPGSPYIAPLIPLEPLIVPPQVRSPEPTVVLRRSVLMPLTGHISKHLVVSIQPPGLKQTTPSLLSAGIAIVPEPVELLRSPLLILPKPTPPTPTPTLHAGVMREAITPPITGLIVPPSIRLISSPTILSGRAGQEIIIPRGQLIVPAQQLPKTQLSIFRQFPSKPTAPPSTFWIPRGWVPDGWVPLPESGEITPNGIGQQLIVLSPEKKKQTPTAVTQSIAPVVPLVWPSRPLIVPAPQQPGTAQPNTLKWRTPPLVAAPPTQPLIVPSQAYPDPRSTLIRSVVQPLAAAPQAQPLIVPGQPSPSTTQAELGWFTPEAIVPPSGQFLIVPPELLPDYTRSRSALSRTTRFPTPTIPPINAQLIARAHPRILYQQPFAILGGESMLIPPLAPTQLDLGLLATYSDGEFIFSRESSSTL